MSKIALQGDASGTGTFTIAAPNSNSNPTLTLPTSSGTVVVTGGAQTIEFAAGTAAAPSITFTGDTNTGIFSPAADTIAFAEGGAEAMRIDSSGNVGIGTTSPTTRLHVSSGNNYANLRVGNGAFASRDNNNDVYLYSNSTTAEKYLVDGEASLIAQDNAIISFYNAPSGTAGNTVTFTERMRIDSSGNVGIGTSSPTTYGGTALVKTINVGSLNNISAGFSDAVTGTLRIAHDANQNIINFDASNLCFQSGGTTPTERARITSGGDFWVGATSFSNSGSGVNISASNTSGGAAGGLTVLNSASASADSSPALVIMKAMTTTTSAARFVQFYANTSSQAMGGIVGNGATNVQFASLSDIRDKTNIQSISGSLEKINLLRPVEFDWIADGSHINAGFIAQEVETVFPEFVVENMSSDGQEDRKGLTGGMTGGIIAHLVKAIQELKAITDAQATRIEALEAEVAALKGQ